MTMIQLAHPNNPTEGMFAAHVDVPIHLNDLNEYKKNGVSA